MHSGVGGVKSRQCQIDVLTCHDLVFPYRNIPKDVLQLSLPGELTILEELTGIGEIELQLRIWCKPFEDVIDQLSQRACNMSWPIGSPIGYRSVCTTVGLNE